MNSRNLARKIKAIKIVSRLVLFSVVILLFLKLTSCGGGLYFLNYNLIDYIIPIFFFGGLLAEVITFFIQKRFGLNVFKRASNLLIISLLLISFGFVVVVFAFPGAGHCGPSKDARIIASLSQARTVMVYTYANEESYDNFSCQNKDMKDLCNEIDERYWSKDNPPLFSWRRSRNLGWLDGKEPIIAHDALKNSQAACIYSPLNSKENHWYCADSSGIAGFTETDPGSKGYCVEGKSAVCPPDTKG